MATLSAGADVNFSGTTFDPTLLGELLSALREQPRTFESPVERYARLRRRHYCFGDAWFDDAQFTGEAWFEGVTFTGQAWFGNATFTGDAWFRKAKFTGDAIFINTTFTGEAVFEDVQFAGDACFVRARFMSEAVFDNAAFDHSLRFEDARLKSTSHLGPVLGNTLDLSKAVFGVPVTIEAAALRVVCERTRWESAAALRLRYATVDPSDAVVTHPIAVTRHPSPLSSESVHVRGDPGVRVVSLRGVDAAHLVLTDIDLTDCVFSGAFHLDQLRVEGNCIFRFPPTGLRRRWIWPEWWSRRRTVAEEHHWRAMPGTRRKPHPGWVGRQPAVQGGPAAERSLRKALEDAKKDMAFFDGVMEMRRHDPGRSLGERRLLWFYWVTSYPALQALLTLDHWRAMHRRPAASDGTPKPGDLAAIYRSLRKAFEDVKNEPDAADFYYGEMEMRRHDPGRSLGERHLLWLYWLLSGYGLRVMRALGWLAFAVALTVLGLMLWGLPADSHPPVQPITGTLSGGSAVDLVTRTPIVSGAAPGPWSEKVSKQRVDRALRVAVNSVAFRSAGQGLTRAGTYIEMGSRLAEPVLLVLVIIAVRGRVKR